VQHTHTPHTRCTRRSVKLAAATADKVVHVFDEAGEKRDKFKTKAADGNAAGAYMVRGLAFSPDSTKLAVAQSDSIVFVYRCACAELS
jgi:intraflagellar transport protein 172